MNTIKMAINKLSGLVFIGLPAAILTLIGLLNAAPVAKADVTPFQELLSGGITGPYGLVNVGMGLEGVPISGTGTIVDVNVPGPVEYAYLLWQGRDAQSADPSDNIEDDEVNFTVNGITNTVVTADRIRVHQQQNVTNRYYYAFLADVTTLVQEGTNDYTLSDFLMQDEEFGWGLFVVYNTGGAQEFNIQILEGLDRFWKDEPAHMHGEVHCVDVEPKTISRSVELDMIAAGIGFERDNQIYYETGLPADAKPTDINGTGTFLGAQPFGQYDGPDWDSYENTTALEIPADHGWICVQITANDGTAPNPPNEVASGMIQLIAFAVPVTTPTAVSLNTLGATAMPGGLPLGLIAIVVGLLAVTALIFFLRR